MAQLVEGSTHDWKVVCSIPPHNVVHACCVLGQDTSPTLPSMNVCVCVCVCMECLWWWSEGP